MASLKVDLIGARTRSSLAGLNVLVANTNRDALAARRQRAPLAAPERDGLRNGPMFPSFRHPAITQ
jgi:hypothetical protein